MSLAFFNTLTSKKEPFVPLNEGTVGMYVCGPTVYDHAHLGHAKSYISFDVVVRYLRALGFRVRYVQNVTDVGHLTDDADEGEDKIAKRAVLERLEPMELVEKYTASFFEDMDSLGNLRPDISPRASGHIIEQIALVEKLLEKGNAYEVNGSIYFSVASFGDYGKLTGRSLDESRQSVRIEHNPEKRSPEDFALWKRAEPSHLMHWPSPWGEGYPGWHLECSAMSMKYLGDTLDIHAGGLENCFPHHECEIAQSEAATGKPFVRYWLHNNMVTVDGQKMGKSLGNFVTLKDLFQRFHPQHVRFLILSSHYRHPLDFTDESLRAAAKGHSRLMSAWNVAKERCTSEQQGLSEIGDSVRDAFPTESPLSAPFQEALAALDDDVNTPRALAALFDASKTVQRAAEEEGNSFPFIHAFQLFEQIGRQVLGLQPIKRPEDSGKDSELIQLLVDIRQELRGKKDWALADQLRNKLANLGILLEDTPNGTRAVIQNKGPQ